MGDVARAVVGLEGGRVLADNQNPPELRDVAHEVYAGVRGLAAGRAVARVQAVVDDELVRGVER